MQSQHALQPYYLSRPQIPGQPSDEQTAQRRRLGTSYEKQAAKVFAGMLLDRK